MVKTKKEKKERQEKTLAKMKKVRYEDTLFLRSIIAKKLQWAREERQKGLDTIKKLENNLVEIRKSILRLDGCIVAFTEISETKKEK